MTLPQKTIGRRGFLKASARAAAAVALTALSAHGKATPMTTPSITPPIFVAHGAPTLALNPTLGQPLRAWGQTLPKPSAILAISAHWEAAPLTVGSLDHSALLYDFYGFPEALYRVQYPAPAATDLPERIAPLLGLSRSVGADPKRHLDHGVWTPLVHLFPEANIPVVQISMPSAQGPSALVALGRQLAPLAREGVLIMGSGNLVHNLRRVDWSPSPQTPAWASEFDAWVAQAISAQDLDALVNFQHTAPNPQLAHPTADHYLPLLVVAAAAEALGLSASFTLSGFEYGSISRRSVQYG